MWFGLFRLGSRYLSVIGYACRAVEQFVRLYGLLDSFIAVMMISLMAVVTCDRLMCCCTALQSLK